VSVAVNHRIDGAEDAPFLVLSNSLGTTHRMWDAQMPALTESFRVLRYDKRGHGESPAPPGPYSIEELAGDVLALLDELEIERPVLWAGVSIGGMTGLWLAANAPERIERLAVCCTAAHLPPAEMWRDRAASVRAEGMPAVTETTLERWFSPDLHEQRPDVVERFRADLLDTPPEGYASCCEAIAGHDLRDRLESIAAPTLVVAGEDDPATPPELGREIADGLPGARFELLPGARHLANVERAEEVNRLLLEHLGAGARA
jgi:3-oxoadipate enol-lactonase